MAKNKNKNKFVPKNFQKAPKVENANSLYEDRDFKPNKFGLISIMPHNNGYAKMKFNCRTGVVYNTNVIKTPTMYLLLNYLIAQCSANRTGTFFGYNTTIIKDFLNKSGVELKEARVSENLARMIEGGFINIYVNNTLRQPKRRNHYKDYTDGQVTKKGRIIDHSKEHYRTIELNHDIITEATSIVDLNDPRYLASKTRSRFRKFVKHKMYIHKDGVAKEFKNIQARVKENNDYLRSNLSEQLASSNAAIGYFVKYTSNKIFDIGNSTYHDLPLFTSKQQVISDADTNYITTVHNYTVAYDDNGERHCLAPGETLEQHLEALSNVTADDVYDAIKVHDQSNITTSMITLPETVDYSYMREMYSDEADMF